MKLRYLIGAALIFSASVQVTVQREVCYARAGQNVMLHIPWGSGNYGDIQWQVSNDNGATWVDISNATTPAYTFRADNPTPTV